MDKTICNILNIAGVTLIIATLIVELSMFV
jgi:hypothetical protein